MKEIAIYIRRGTGYHSRYLYGEIRDYKTREIMVAASANYCEGVIKSRGYIIKELTVKESETINDEDKEYAEILQRNFVSARAVGSADTIRRQADAQKIEKLQKAIELLIFSCTSLAKTLGHRDGSTVLDWLEQAQDVLVEMEKENEHN